RPRAGRSCVAGVDFVWHPRSLTAREGHAPSFGFFLRLPQQRRHLGPKPIARRTFLARSFLKDQVDLTAPAGAFATATEVARHALVLAAGVRQGVAEDGRRPATTTGRRECSGVTHSFVLSKYSCPTGSPSMFARTPSSRT